MGGTGVYNAHSPCFFPQGPRILSQLFWSKKIWWPFLVITVILSSKLSQILLHWSKSANKFKKLVKKYQQSSPNPAQPLYSPKGKSEHYIHFHALPRTSRWSGWSLSWTWTWCKRGKSSDNCDASTSNPCQNLARLRELQKSLQWEVTGLPHPFLQVKLRMMPYYIIGTHVQQPTTGIKAPHRVYFRSTILDFIFLIFTWNVSFILDI